MILGTQIIFFATMILSVLSIDIPSVQLSSSTVTGLNVSLHKEKNRFRF